MTAPAHRAVLEAAGIEVHARPENWTALASDVLEGLRGTPKTLPPKWFYDARGSELFEAITALDAYYPTRRERALLAEAAPAVAARVAPAEVIELGSGSSTKTPLLLDPAAEAGTLRSYVPVDVSASALEAAVPALARRYPGIEVCAEVCDFGAELPALPRPDGPRLVAFLGSTIGNLQPVEVRAFLARVRPLLGPGDALLIGCDLVKDPAVVHAAYDDPQGVTAAFNRNVLAVLNRELGGEFALDRFDHEAVWNPALERIEMRLRSTCAQVVRISALGIEVPFLAGESILTEISRKFRREGVERAYAESGLRPCGWHEDADGWYALSLAELA